MNKGPLTLRLERLHELNRPSVVRWAVEDLSALAALVLLAGCLAVWAVVLHP